LPGRATASGATTGKGFELLEFLAEQSQRPITFLALLDLPALRSRHMKTASSV